MYFFAASMSLADLVSDFVNTRYIGRFDSFIVSMKSVNDLVICWFMSLTNIMPSAFGKKFTNVCLCFGSGDDNPGVSTNIVVAGTRTDVSKTVTTFASARASFFRLEMSSISMNSFFSLRTEARHESQPKCTSYIVAVVGFVAVSSFLLSVSELISVVFPELNSPTKGNTNVAFSC